jgi:hypothetical protein
MHDKLQDWITALEEIKENILNTLHYNGLILDDIDRLIKDIQAAQRK